MIHAETDWIPAERQEPVLVWHLGIPLTLRHLVQLPVQTLLDYPYHGMRVCGL